MWDLARAISATECSHKTLCRRYRCNINVSCKSFSELYVAMAIDVTLTYRSPLINGQGLYPCSLVSGRRAGNVTWDWQCRIIIIFRKPLKHWVRNYGSHITVKDDVSRGYSIARAFGSQEPCTK